MPLYEFKCPACGSRTEEYFKADEEKRSRCKCGELRARVFTPWAVHMPRPKPPKGGIETGNEEIKADIQPDRYENAEREMHQIIEQCPDLDGSGDCELSRLHA